MIYGVQRIPNMTSTLFLSVCLPVCSFSFSQYATRLETAESGWRHVKYSLAPESSRSQEPDVTHCTEGASLQHSELQ